MVLGFFIRVLWFHIVENIGANRGPCLFPEVPCVGIGCWSLKLRKPSCFIDRPAATQEPRPTPHRDPSLWLRSGLFGSRVG